MENLWILQNVGGSGHLRGQVWGDVWLFQHISSRMISILSHRISILSHMISEASNPGGGTEFDAPSTGRAGALGRGRGGIPLPQD